jgi:transposase
MAEPSYEELRAENERLRRRISELEAQIERLTQALEASQRSGKRQAAPFSKGMPQPQPKKPGRKPGDDYGAKAHRPPPRRIDETYEAHLPQACPHCHSAVNETAVQDQYQVEIPRRPIQRRFRVHLGECSGCGAALQGRHPLQTSDALGAAGSGLGADAQASVCWLNKSAGLSHGKIVKLLKTLFGIELSRGGSAQIVARGGRRCEPAYKEIQEAIRGSPTNAADETGWRIGGQSAWQHVLVNERATCYLIDRSRGADVPARVLSFDYDGVLLHDGWAAYGQFTRAVHGQCNAHALRRAHELHETVGRSPRRWLRRVQDVFRLQLRVLGFVAAVDLLLAPIGLLAAAASEAGQPAYLALAPVALLLLAMARDRRARIDQSAARLDELERGRERLSGAMHRLGVAFSSGLDVSAITALAAEAATDGTGADAGRARIREHDEIATVGAISAPLLVLLAEAERHAMRSREAGVAERDGLVAASCAAGGAVLSVGRAGAPFSRAELELLAHLAAHAAMSAENAELHAAMRRQATLDGLTGLANRRRFDASLRDELGRRGRFGEPLALVLFDIDDFKRINDTYGHQHGDAVLRAVAGAVAANCRGSDVAARIGGEEFALLLPHTSPAEGAAAAEAARARVAGLRVAGPCGEITVSVSAGLATCPPDGTTPDELIAAADQALYQAKRSGKDLLVVHQ